LEENGAAGFKDEWRKVTDEIEGMKEKAEVVPCDEDTARNLVTLAEKVNSRELPRRGGETN
jgi:hypothetical protein